VVINPAFAVLATRQNAMREREREREREVAFHKLFLISRGLMYLTGRHAGEKVFTNDCEGYTIASNWHTNFYKFYCFSLSVYKTIS
jgi:hypothetical protein